MNLISRRSVLGATLLVLLTPAPALAATSAVTVDGAVNIRDLGGATTGDGHTVRTGLVYRGGSLSRISDTGLTQLRGLGLRWVADSRGQDERQRQGEDRLPPGVSLLSAPIPNNWNGATGGRSTPDPAVLAMFRAFVTDAQARAGVAAPLTKLAGAGVPLFCHDSAGVFRTGWLAAVLLTALGVPRAQVDRDFLLSNEALGDRFAFTEYLDAAFDQVRQDYGSFEEFLSRGLGVTAQQQQRLRAVLLR
ncbi:tyrosine-protein phosphatase [Crossiella sp. SN42]|uniref:tyrosine-protein phosphatase n=1 Tax=Crossiella sp. SN42 TaxID=2944808 RepID=UPI00207C608E|nr:tyrosine-protein phosphatase [Crossiella sp. SN42]MCO1580353.1 tyrosine-protein phosphatase [Crossiella sp. SN42]